MNCKIKIYIWLLLLRTIFKDLIGIRIFVFVFKRV